jgi:hypothetical protein
MNAEESPVYTVHESVRNLVSQPGTWRDRTTLPLTGTRNVASGFSLQFYGEADSSRIPTAPGLYAFYLRPLTPSALGLLDSGVPSPDKAIQVRKRIATMATRFITLLRSAQLRGKIVDNTRAAHIATRIDVVAEQTPDFGKVQDLSKNVPDADLRDVLALMGKISLLSQPVYVGITYDSTLAMRYEQHRQDYFAEPIDLGTFGGRLNATGYEWRDIAFGCMPTSDLQISAKSLEFLEKYFQSLSCPVLSIR